LTLNLPTDEVFLTPEEVLDTAADASTALERVRASEYDLLVAGAGYLRKPFGVPEVLVAAAIALGTPAA